MPEPDFRPLSAFNMRPYLCIFTLFVSNPEACGYEESRKYLLTAVQLAEAEVFPLSFRLRVPVAGDRLYTGGVLP